MSGKILIKKEKKMIAIITVIALLLFLVLSKINKVILCNFALFSIFLRIHKVFPSIIDKHNRIITVNYLGYIQEYNYIHRNVITKFPDNDSMIIPFKEVTIFEIV